MLCGFFMIPLKEEPVEMKDVDNDNDSEVRLNINTGEYAQSEMSDYCEEEVTKEADTGVLSQMLHSTWMFRNVSFSLFCVNNFLFFGALSILWVNLNGYIIKSQLGDAADAGFIYSVIGISNVVGRLLLGVFVDHRRVNPVVVFTTGNFFLALNEMYAAFFEHSYRGK